MSKLFGIKIGNVLYLYNFGIRIAPVYLCTYLYIIAFAGFFKQF